MPFITRDGVADAPMEPGLRTLCEPCVTGPRREAVTLDRALEALADGDAGDLDAVARLERLHGDLGPDVQTALSSELDEVPVRS